MDAGLLKKWESLAGRYDELTTQLTDPTVIGQPSLLVKLTKERTEIESVAELFHRYEEILKQLDEAAHMLADPAAGSELRALATRRISSWKSGPGRAETKPPCSREICSGCM